MTGSLTATLWKSGVPCKPRCVRLAYRCRRSASSTLRPLQAITTTSCRPRCGGYTFRDQSAPDPDATAMATAAALATAAGGCPTQDRWRRKRLPDETWPRPDPSSARNFLTACPRDDRADRADCPRCLLWVLRTGRPDADTDHGDRHSDSKPDPPPSTAQPTASPKRRAQSPARFDHFVVTVDDLRRASPSEVRLLAKVCVRSLPPDPQGAEPESVGTPGRCEQDHE